MRAECEVVAPSFPHPLSSPPDWRSPQSGSTFHFLSLEFTALHGGPWLHWARRVQQSGSWAWRLDSGWSAIENDPILRESIRSLLRGTPLQGSSQSDAVGSAYPRHQTRVVQVRTSLNPEELELRWDEIWQSEAFDIEVEARAEEVPEDTVLWWAEQIFPGLRSAVGDGSFTQWLQSYEQEWRGGQELPWDRLRFFVGHLRQRLKIDESMISLAALEWARFQTLYSPQNEAHEAQMLKESELVLNPTWQAVRTYLSSQEQMQILWRVPEEGPWGFDVRERALDWQSAAAIDELAESPKINKFKLLSSLTRTYGLSTSESESTLARLINEGVVLFQETARI